MSFLSGIFTLIFLLHDLCHEAAHGLCGLVLLLPCGMSIGAERKSGIVVPQHTADRFHIDAILERQRGEGVPQIMKSDMRQSCVLQDLLMKVHDGVRIVHLTCDRRGE